MEEQKPDILNVYLDLFLKEIGEENINEVMING